MPDKKVKTIEYNEYKQDKAAKVLKNGSWKKDFKQNYSLYILMIPIVVYFIIFNYIPMFGILIAFENYRPALGVFKSEWVGFQNFIDLFTSNSFARCIKNTVCMGIVNSIFGFFAPVIFAILLSEVRFPRFKRATQLISYLPNFVSTVVVCSLAGNFLAYDGFITLFLDKLGLHTELGWLFENGPSFWLINSLIGVWQGMGWGSIVYMAGIAQVNGNLHEAAAIDGAGRFQRLFHVTIPNVMPLFIMTLTVNIGVMFIAGFDKVLLLYSPIVYDYADVLQTYIHRLAFASTPNYGLSTASGLFQSLVATIMLIVSNKLGKKASGFSLF